MSTSSEPDAAQSPTWVEGGKLCTEVLKAEVCSCAEKLASSSPSAQREGADHLHRLILLVWAQDTHIARDAADIVCDDIRLNGGLNSMLELCSADKNVTFSVLRALEQIMVSANRHYISDHKHFDCLVKLACCTDSLEAVQCGTGILENLFKESSTTCLRLIKGGALKGLICACRHSDPVTLQHCAAALANSAMYGDCKVQRTMVSKKVDVWLFPLAFSLDKVVKYYALLAICFLAANVNLAKQVAESGTLELVLPFLRNQDPEEFAASCPSHAHGRSTGWLQHLVPLLVSHSEEARSLAAFHFAMEATIKKKQQRLQVFDEIGVAPNLRMAAKNGSRLTAKYCCQSLSTIGADLPAYQCWDVLRWDTDCVSAWVEDIGLSCLAPMFRSNHITGCVLIDVSMDELREIGFDTLVKRRWFMDEVKRLRCLADVSVEDRDGVCKWLTEVSRDLEVYRVDFVRNGVTRSLLPHLTEETLTEIGVTSKIDQLKILLAIGRLPESLEQDSPDCKLSLAPLTTAHARSRDVFISYRRSTGSQLASLLKVHLQVRGITVFLDVAELGSGKFDEAILTTISRSHNMIIVLSPDALTRCVGDERQQDWVHKELACAMDNQVHIVPVVTEEFTWPDSSKLPEDIQAVCKMNAVMWSHEYQDASVDKIVKFLHLPTTTRRKSFSISFDRSLSTPRQRTPLAQ